MIYCRFATMLALIASITFQFVPEVAADPLEQSAQLRAGLYFPASRLFSGGNAFEHTGIELAYSLKPFPYAQLESAIGYYRADTNIGFISAAPLTVTANAILPLPYINLHAGGGGGVYYKMSGGQTELPPDRSEFSLGYHATTGIEFRATKGLSLLLDYKYVVVDQGKFKTYNIKHGGDFLYGGFSVIF